MSGMWTGLAISAIGAGASADSQRKGRKLQKKGAKKQEEQMDMQRLDEKKRLGEAESEIGRKKALKQGGGRSMLMSAGSPQGASTIGG
jgi:hypothetical protein